MPRLILRSGRGPDQPLTALRREPLRTRNGRSRVGGATPYEIHTVRDLPQTGSSQVPAYVGHMRNAIVQLPAHRTTGEHRPVLRAAIRQVERAETYMAAVAHMDLDDSAAERVVRQLRADLDALRRHLGEQRARARD